MSQILELKLKTYPHQQKFLEGFLFESYKFYIDFVKAVNSRIETLINSESWHLNLEMRKSLMALYSLEFEKATYELSDILNYIDSEIEGASKPEKVRKDFEKLKIDEITSEIDTFKVFLETKPTDSTIKAKEKGLKNRHQILSLLSLIRYVYKSNARIGATKKDSNATHIRISENELYKDWLNNSRLNDQNMNWIFNDILGKSIETKFKADSSKFGYIRSKKFKDFNSLFLGQARGTDKFGQFKMNWNENKVSFVDKQTKKETSFFLRPIQDRKSKLILKNIASQRLAESAKANGERTSGYWYFKYATLVRKTVASGAVQWYIQIYVNDIPEHNPHGNGKLALRVNPDKIAIYSDTESIQPQIISLNPYHSTEIEDKIKELRSKANEIFLNDNRHLMHQVVSVDKEGLPETDEDGNIIYKMSFNKDTKSDKIFSKSFKRLTNKATGLQKAQTRKRQIYFNTLINQLLEGSEHIVLEKSLNIGVKSTTVPKESKFMTKDEKSKIRELKKAEKSEKSTALNFAPALFIETLKKKVGYFDDFTLDILESKTEFDSDSELLKHTQMLLD